jgi:hypothetical protein
MKKISILTMALACLVWSAPTGIRRISLDSLTEYSNIRLQASGNLILEDSLYCDNLILESNASTRSKQEDSISSFKCNHLEVIDFTFRGFQGEFVEVIYQPNGTKEAYFGKARIRKSDVLSAYILVNNDGALSRMSENRFEEISKVTGVTTIIVVAVGAIVISLLLFAATLASSPFP